MKLQQIGWAAVATSLTLSGVSVLGMPSAEAFTIYTDRTAWLTALGGASVTTDTFSTVKPNAQTITFDSGVTSTGNGTGDGSNSVDGSRFFGTVDGQGDNPGAFDTITWSFPQAITAFGADWFNTASGDLLTLSGDFDGTGTQTVSFNTQLGSPGDGFLGIIGNASFSSITFGTEGAAGQGGLETFTADNLSFGTAATPIPTPALLPGLVGMGIAAWRKRKAVSQA